MPLDYVTHVVETTPGPFDDRPFHAQCSCGTAGDFSSQAEADAWFQNRHFSRLSGMAASASGVVVTGQEPEPAPPEPEPPAPGPAPEPTPTPTEPVEPAPEVG